MKHKSRGEIFVRESVIGLGFLSGLWIRVGVDPQAEMFNALVPLVKTLDSSPTISFAFLMMPAILTIFSWASAYKRGGLVGIIAVTLALAGGIFVTSQLGILALLSGIVAGFIAPWMKKTKK